MARYACGAAGDQTAEPGADIEWFQPEAAISRSAPEANNYTVSLCGRYRLGINELRLRVRVNTHVQVRPVLHGHDLEQMSDGIIVTACDIEVFNGETRIACAGTSATQFLGLPVEEIETGIVDPVLAHPLEPISANERDGYVLSTGWMAFEHHRATLTANFAEILESALLALLFPLGTARDLPAA